mmetsp:Transcript_529/g.1816  ORF Transcript_529/g.1816 Transcript_529/m.1816 type:complete len:228 (-) Transcript_529:809-1492(-)
MATRPGARRGSTRPARGTCSSSSGASRATPQPTALALQTVLCTSGATRACTSLADSSSAARARQSRRPTAPTPHMGPGACVPCGTRSARKATPCGSVSSCWRSCARTRHHPRRCRTTTGGAGGQAVAEVGVHLRARSPATATSTTGCCQQCGRRWSACRLAWSGALSGCSSRHPRCRCTFPTGNTSAARSSALLESMACSSSSTPRATWVRRKASAPSSSIARPVSP